MVLNTAISKGSQEWSKTINARITAGKYDLATIHRTDGGRSILPAGYDMYSEIIAINGTAAQVVDWWMSSPAHRTAMLDKRATDIGIGFTKTTVASWSGMNVVVANIAGYPATRVNQPKPVPVPIVNVGDVAAVDTDGGLYIYPSAKGGDLWKRNRVSLGWSGVQQVAVSDFNKDGLADIIAVWKDGRLTLSLGQKDGTLQPQQNIGLGWGSYQIVVTTWKTGDAFPSIAAKHRTTGDLWLYPNVNGKNFGARVKIGAGWGALEISGADFDGDGKQDLLAKNKTGDLLLYRGNGTGTFFSETRRVVGKGWNGMTHISGISNHLGTKAFGILTRDSSGNLYHYPLLKNAFGQRTLIGNGGWSPLLLGS